MASKIEKRDVTIVARYFVKNGKDAGNVLLLVRNDQGKEYCVTLRPNKKHSCTCLSRKVCYHIEAGRTSENARHDAKKAAALLAEVESICQAAETELEATPPVDFVPAREKAPLNGNRPFSILRV